MHSLESMLHAALIPLVDTVVLIYRIASRIRLLWMLEWIEGPRLRHFGYTRLKSRYVKIKLS